MKRTIAKYITIFGLLLLISFGCKKSGDDTLVLLGDEDNIVDIDEIYPRKYRLQWPDIDETDYYSLEIDTVFDIIWNENHDSIISKTIVSIDTTLIPSINDYVFPPNLMGEFIIKGIRKGGNETLHNGTTPTPDPDSSLYNKVPVDGMNIKMTITQQQNAYAHVSLVMYNEYGGDNNIVETDHVYLYGDYSTGKFSLCFDATVPSGSMMSLNYAYLVTGVVGDTTIITPNNDTINPFGIKDVRFWLLVKGMSGVSQIYTNTGGQRFYMDSINIAIRTKSPDEL